MTENRQQLNIVVMSFLPILVILTALVMFLFGVYYEGKENSHRQEKTYVPPESIVKEWKAPPPPPRGVMPTPYPLPIQVDPIDN